VDDDAVGYVILETVLSYFGAICPVTMEGFNSESEIFIAENFDLAVIESRMPEFSGFECGPSNFRATPLFEKPNIAMTA